jgi:transposase
MFFRARKRGPHTYLQIVENNRIDGKVVQKVHMNMGRLDQLQEAGTLDGLLRSGIKFSKRLTLLDAHAKGVATEVSARKIGPPLLVEKLWRESGIKSIIESLLSHRRFDYSVERIIFVTVLHRLFNPGSDRAAERWMRSYAIEGTVSLELHHFYRAMAWLGEPLHEKAQIDATSHSPLCIKDLIEEGLFALHRDLFSDLSLVFFDTTALYFEGNGGQSIGQYGHSKDHRPDLRQMVVGVILDNEGNPVCSELWPGNIADVTSLVPVMQRLKRRFGIERVCIVADRGMISETTIAEIEREGWEYILGVRMRRVNEVHEEVLARGGRYQEIYPQRHKSDDPAPLKIKEVIVEKKRYIVCHNEEEARKDRYDREAIVASLRRQLKQGDKSLVGNKGYRRFLKGSGCRFEIDEEKIAYEERFDGKWVLRTNTDLDSATVALKYKQLWTVEDIFRTMKTILETRPIYHHWDETIRGHVFCSFLALVIRKQLQDRIDRKGWKLEWANVVDDIDALEEITLSHQGNEFVLRTETKGVAGKMFQAAGVALPQVLKQTKCMSTTPVPYP